MYFEKSFFKLSAFFGTFSSIFYLLDPDPHYGSEVLQAQLAYSFFFFKYFIRFFTY